MDGLGPYSWSAYASNSARIRSRLIAPSMYFWKMAEAAGDGSGPSMRPLARALSTLCARCSRALSALMTLIGRTSSKLSRTDRIAAGAMKRPELLMLGPFMVEITARVYFNACSMAEVSSGDSGSTLESNLAMMLPSRPIRNLVKFHFTSPLAAVRYL